jgi:predicted transcriptional regulator
MPLREAPVPRDRVKTLVALYDQLDHHLKAELKRPAHEGFTAVVGRAADAGLVTAEEQRVCELAGWIRNILVHDASSGSRVVVPTAEMLARLGSVVESVTRPPRAIPTFQRVVETLQSNSSLAGVLKIIGQRDYSQFPVYRSGRFFGLLTENGITRWLSKHVAAKGSVVSVGAAEVREVLESEEANHLAAEFVAKGEAVGVLAQRFQKSPLLEAVLITSNGFKNERLLGIATRWDIASLPAAHRKAAAGV